MATEWPQAQPFSSGVAAMTRVEARRHPKTNRPMPSNYRTAPASALAQELFLQDGSLAQAGDGSRAGTPPLGEERVRHVRELILQAQRTALQAVDPLLQAYRLLQSGPTVHGADLTRLRAARAALRDAIAYFLIPQTLGLDSKNDFLNALKSVNSGVDRDIFSSQMQNSYMKLLRNLQTWFANMDLATGRPAATDGKGTASIALEKAPEVEARPPGQDLQAATAEAALAAWRWQFLGLSRVEPRSDLPAFSEDELRLVAHQPVTVSFLG